MNGPQRLQLSRSDKRSVMMSHLERFGLAWPMYRKLSDLCLVTGKEFSSEIFEKVLREAGSDEPEEFIEYLLDEEERLLSSKQTLRTIFQESESKHKRVLKMESDFRTDSKQILVKVFYFENLPSLECLIEVICGEEVCKIERPDSLKLFLVERSYHIQALDHSIFVIIRDSSGKILGRSSVNISTLIPEVMNNFELKFANLKEVQLPTTAKIGLMLPLTSSNQDKVQARAESELEKIAKDIENVDNRLKEIYRPFPELRALSKYSYQFKSS